MYTGRKRERDRLIEREREREITTELDKRRKKLMKEWQGC